MQNKYYTPKIEEFHLGFLYEIKDVEQSAKVGEDVWHTLPYNGNPKFYVLDSLIEQEEVKVKYLYKEDIEDFGFKETHVPDEECDLVPGYTFNKSNILHYVLYVEEGKYVITENKTYDEESGNHFTEVVFKGVIKNKSELHTLLKQLNII